MWCQCLKFHSYLSLPIKDTPFKILKDIQSIWTKISPLMSFPRRVLHFFVSKQGKNLKH